MSRRKGRYIATFTAVMMAPYFRNSKKATVVENFLSRTSSIMMLEAAPSRVRFPQLCWPSPM